MRLYKITFYVSIGFFVLCLLLSGLCACVETVESKGITFFKDCMIGIACSSAVVIVQTFLQFRFEQQKVLKSLISNVRFFFFRYMLIAISYNAEEGEVPDTLWEHFYDNLQEDIRKITDELSSIDWILKRNEKKTSAMYVHFLELLIEMRRVESNKENAVKVIMIHPSVKEIKEIAIELGKHQKNIIDEIVNNFKKAEGFLNGVKTQNDS